MNLRQELGTVFANKQGGNSASIEYLHTMKYLFVIEKCPRNLSGYFPDVPGCITTGKTVEKILANAHEALELHFMEEPKCPRARTLAWHLDKGGLKLAATDLVTWVQHEKTGTLAAA